MTQQIIDTGLVANDGTGESLRNAFTAVNNNFANVWAAGPVDTQVVIYSNVVSTNVTNLDLRLAGNGIGTITVESTMVPSIDRVYDLGTPSKQYDSVYAQYYFGNGAFLTGISGGNGSVSNSFSTISANGVSIVAASATDTLTLASGNNVVILGNSATDTVSISLVNNPIFSGNITAAGNIIGSNINAVNLSLSGNVVSALAVSGNVTAPYLFGNGSQLTGVVTSLGGNLAANINTGTYSLYSSNGAVKVDDALSVTGTVITTGGVLSGGPIATTANVTAGYFIGDGSQLTNLPAGNYSNANVAAYLPTYTGNVSAGNVSATGNIQGSYLLGNGSQLTGISASLSGNLSGNINTGPYNLYSGNGAVRVDDSLSVTGTVTTTGGLVTPGPVATTANVTANYFIGDGSQLTNLPAGNYSNANVAAYLPTYTGNVSANYFVGNGATLTSITGANVSGIVANAAYAVTANSAVYATNSTQATYATVANSVAGANVLGTVANANVANSATTAGTAQYVTANAQANITSVGILTSLSASGNITGSYILGNGSQLTGITASLNGNLTGNINTGIYNIYSTSGPVTINDGLSVTGTVTTTGGLITPGPVATTANVTANYFIGDGSQLTNLPAGNYSNANVAAYLPTYTGNVSATNFIGNGATLTNIAGANVAGAVANATYAVNANTAAYATNSGQATYATVANSVAGANVSGTVANATYALTSNASSYTNRANIADVANAVAGANVSGTVANATYALNANSATYATLAVNATQANYANTANSVTGSNVVGIVANAVYATTASTATSANSAGTAQYVTANAQANITSVGVLTSLSSTGNITGSYILGNGSQLTGIASSLNGNLTGNINTGPYNLFSSNGAVLINDSLSVTGTITTVSGIISGSLVTTANVTANYFIGDGSQLTNLPAGDYSNANVAAYLPTYTGNVSANNFIGNGATLTNITGANIVGAVANATYALNSNSAVYATNSGLAVYAATANSVAGANVSGTVSNAVYALNSTYSSFTNYANIANVANSVAGANVSGTVANATYALNSNSSTYTTYAVNTAQANYANTANAVAGSNVVGIVANATYATTSGSATTATTAGTAQYVTANVQGNITSVGVLTSLSSTGNITGAYVIGNGSQLTGVVKSIAGNLAGNIDTLEYSINSSNGEVRFGNTISVIGNATITDNLLVGDQIATTGNITTTANVHASFFVGNFVGNIAGNLIVPGLSTEVVFNTNGQADATSGLTFNKASNVLTVGGNVSAIGNVSGNYILGNGSQLTGLPALYGNANVADYLAVYTGNISAGNVSVIGNVVADNVSTVGNVSANVLVGNTATLFGNITTTANVIASYFVGNFAGNISGNLTVPGVNTQVIFNTNGSADATSGLTFDKVSNVFTAGGNVSAIGNISGNYILGNGSQLTGIDATSIQNGNSNVSVAANGNVSIGIAGTSNVVVISTGGQLSAVGNITGNYISGNGTQLTGILGNNANMGSNTAGAFISNAVTLTTTTTVTNGIALLNQVLGKLVPPAPPNFPNATTIALSGITTYRMANITQVDNTPGANRAVAAGTSVANVLRVATYATNTISTVGPGDAGIITAVRNGANVGTVTLNTNASPTANGTYGGNLVITNNYDYHTANANIAAGFWYVFSAAVSGATAAGGWNELYIADSSTGNTNTTVWYYDNSSPATPSFSSTTMTPPGSANLLYSSTIPHYTNNNNFTIGFNVANISGNTYPTSNTLASGSSGGAFTAPASINYSASNIGSNVLNSFASASANTTASITTGFGSSSTGPSMSVNNSYSTGTLTLTTALGNTVLWKSGTATAIDESNVVIGSTIGTGSGNAYRIINPGTGNTPAYTGSEAAFNSQSSTLQTYDATVVGSGSSGLLKHDQTNYSTGYLPAGPNLSSGRTGTQYFTIKFVRTAVSKFDIKYSGNVAGMWVALPGSVIDSSSSANGWINMSVAYGGAGYPGVNSPGNGSDGCAVGGTVSLNTAVTNSSKTCTFGTVSSSSTATNEIYVRIALASGQSVTALTLETASN
jgi:hypothetical protein